MNVIVLEADPDIEDDAVLERLGSADTVSVRVCSLVRDGVLDSDVRCIDIDRILDVDADGVPSVPVPLLVAIGDTLFVGVPTVMEGPSVCVTSSDMEGLFELEKLADVERVRSGEVVGVNEGDAAVCEVETVGSRLSDLVGVKLPSVENVSESVRVDDFDQDTETPLLSEVDGVPCDVDGDDVTDP